MKRLILLFLLINLPTVYAEEDPLAFLKNKDLKFFVDMTSQSEKICNKASELSFEKNNECVGSMALSLVTKYKLGTSIYLGVATYNFTNGKDQKLFNSINNSIATFNAISKKRIKEIKK